MSFLRTLRTASPLRLSTPSTRFSLYLCPRPALPLIVPVLHSLRPYRDSTQKRKRVARGNASGSGTTAGRGTKGQQSRAGKGRNLGFEGGQTPFIRRQPKLGGFRNPNRIDYEIINIDTLEAKLEAGSYDQATLTAKRLLNRKLSVKLLGRGTVTKKFALTVGAVTKSAKEAIEKAGGSVTIAKN